MPLLIADCPRCRAQAITFDVKGHVFRHREYSWQNWHEVFSVCRHCQRPTIFLIKMSTAGYRTAIGEKVSENPDLIMSIDSSLSTLFDVDRFISIKDNGSEPPPEHLPEDLEAIFREGTTCLAVSCYNAAATMFRLCLDIVSRPLLPDPADTTQLQPNSKQRRDLGLRLAWLFDNGRLPDALRELARCIREDANDGAHQGNLSKEDAMDVLEFT